MLASHAGDKPLSTYVRDYVLRAHKAKRRPRRKQATADQKELALLLALLGRSEISPLLREVLSCAETRKLLLDEEIKAELRQACADIATIRTTLILALGLRSGAVS
ncbi:hypothetical protein FJU08_22325 [Martelella alba]|uniref:Uncharacterized protein n=1 Tax=Martelella alba TaxID=2590451 RepID=A0A506TZL9_9HYPH|nr:hypothetical protein [Martelella alba]TPW26421.1 hypothetical protein FJU08_22325 [Martelella alba]